MRRFYLCLFLLSIAYTKAQVILDFEAEPVGAYTGTTTVSGWTVSSQSATSCTLSPVWTAGSPEFSVMATPILSAFPPVNPYGFTPLSASPISGTNIVQMNDTNATGLRTRIAQNIPVTSSNCLFEYAFAGLWEDGGHLCCEQAGITINLYNCSGSLVAYWSKNFNANGASCAAGAPSFTNTNGWTWSGWQHEWIDLTAYMGSCVTVEVISSDCIYGTHAGVTYFDALNWAGFQGTAANLGGSPVNSNRSDFCPGASIAKIQAPLGYASYQWYRFSPSNVLIPIGSLEGGTSSQVTITNPVAGTMYTLQLVTANGYTYTQVDTLSFSSVSVSATGAYPSCITGASGSGTVLAIGSGSGYNYSWSGASGPLPSYTTAALANLLPGIYTVTISAINNGPCGTATAAINIGTVGTQYTPLIKPYCGTIAYLSAPAGSGYQWYDGSTIIPANQGGTASGYTVNAAAQGSSYQLSYQSIQGCRDSIQFLLNTIPSGSLAISYNQPICQGGTNGMAVISLTPSSMSFPASNSFTIIDAGSYSVSAPASSATTFTFSNLTAVNIYSITATDGTCIYTSTLAPNTVANIFISLYPMSTTLCPGSTTQGGAVFSQSVNPSQYTFSWTPNQFLYNNNANMPATIITPSTAGQGQVSTLIYTVTGTPTLVNCPVSHTMAITLINFATPTLSGPPMLCDNTGSGLLVANPIGGIFTSSGPAAFIDALTGVITPSVAGAGAYTYSYSQMPGTCAPSASASINIDAAPLISIAGPTAICQGGTVDLMGYGASIYKWSTNSIVNYITVSPTTTTVYTVTGTDLVGCIGTASVTIQVNICAGLQLQTPQALFDLYPNPTSGSVYVQVSSDETKLLVYNQLGSLLLEKTVTNGLHSIDLSAFSNGIYFIKALNGTRGLVQKIVKEN